MSVVAIKSNNPGGDGTLVLPQYPIDVLPQYPIDVLQYQGTRYNGMPIIRMDQQPTQPVPTSNKFSWRTLVHAAIRSLPFGEILDAIATGLGLKSTVGIDPGEVTQVQEWFRVTFMPFLGTFTAAADAIRKKTGSLSVDDLNVLNNTLNQLCIIQGHFAENDQTTFLGEDALDYRFDMIKDYCTAIANAIKDKIYASSSNVTVTAVNVQTARYHFSPLVNVPMAATYQCTNYSFAKGGTQVLPTTTNSGVKTAVTTTTTTSTTPTPIQNTPAKNGRLLFWGSAAVITAIVVALTGGEKKSKKSN